VDLRALRLPAAIAALVAGAPAAAAPRVSVGPVRGEGGPALARQIATAVCAVYECVPRREVATGGKVDLEKMRALEVTGFLFGAVSQKGGAASLWLALVKDEESPSRTWTIPVPSADGLAPEDLARLLDELAPLLGAAPPGADARPRIALGAVSGEGGDAVMRQISEALCAQFACVPRARVLSKGKVDYEKMAAARVAGYLLGSVAGETPWAWLSLSTEPGRSRTFGLPLSGGALSPEALAELVAGVGAELRREPAAEPSAEPGLEPPVEQGGASPLPEGAPVAAEPPPPADEAPPRPAPAEEASPPAPRDARGRPPLASAEAGVFMTSRSLTYSGSPAPSGYSLPLAVGPWVGVEIFPAALATDGALSGLGAVASYGTSVGLSSSTPAGGSVASTLWWLRAGAEWRLHPIAGSGFALTPGVAYLLQKFTLGDPYPGLPDSSLSGLEGSLRFDVPVAERVSIRAAAAYVYWFTAEQLVGSAQYYQSGLAWGLEGQAGLDVKVWGPLSVRGLALVSLTVYQLSASAATPYKATGAKDLYLGGRLTVVGEL